MKIRTAAKITNRIDITWNEVSAERPFPLDVKYIVNVSANGFGYSKNQIERAIYKKFAYISKHRRSDLYETTAFAMFRKNIRDLLIIEHVV